MGFPGGLDGEESACNAGDLSSIPGLGRSPGEGHGNPLQYSYLENPHGQRSLAGYSPWGYKESDMTERLSTTQTMALVFLLQCLLPRHKIKIMYFIKKKTNTYNVRTSMIPEDVLSAEVDKLLKNDQEIT